MQRLAEAALAAAGSAFVEELTAPVELELAIERLARARVAAGRRPVDDEEREMLRRLELEHLNELAETVERLAAEHERIPW